MGNAAKHDHHAIDYIELTVTDVAAAKRFYGAAFDWSFNDYGPDYAGIKGETREVGGLTKGTVTRGGPLVVLFSNNLDDTLKRVREAGGKIVKDPFEFPGGRRFQFLDPSGNELGVWSER
jgi:predicted enzyme related to lactoylglutathione lyase